MFLGWLDKVHQQTELEKMNSRLKKENEALNRQLKKIEERWKDSYNHATELSSALALQKENGARAAALDVQLAFMKTQLNNAELRGAVKIIALFKKAAKSFYERFGIGFEFVFKRDIKDGQFYFAYFKTTSKDGANVYEDTYENCPEPGKLKLGDCAKMKKN
jgi:hypothetical protein